VKLYEAVGVGEEVQRLRERTTVFRDNTLSVLFIYLFIYSLTTLPAVHNAGHGSPTRGPPSSVMRSAANLFIMQILQNVHSHLGSWVYHLFSVFPRAARERADNNGCGALPCKGLGQCLPNWVRGSERRKCVMAEELLAVQNLYVPV
jgi:hypothetical protein